MSAAELNIVTTKLITALAVLLMSIVVLSLALFINQRESLLLDGQVQLPILQRPVQIYFDQLSIPYIEATSEKDLTIAQGFVTASQRLFQMELLRRVAKGEMSAIFGSSCLVNDKLARVLGFRRIAEAEYTLITPEAKKWLKAYCQGVNAYISQGKLPLEFFLLGYEPQPWQPEDTLAILKYLQYASDECWQLNVLQDAIAQKSSPNLAKQMFGASYKAGNLSLTDPTLQTKQYDSTSSRKEDIQNSGTDKQESNGQEIQQPLLNHVSWQQGGKNPNQLSVLLNLISQMPQAAQRSWGSTGWVISKKLSASPGSLLACGKDTLFNFPDLFFLSSLRAPFLHIAGITIPGVPGILIGRNDHICWAAISLKERSQELTLESFSDKHPNQYQNNHGYFHAQVIQEDIAERFAFNRIEKITLTKDGPLLTKTGQVGVALSWYGFNPTNNVINSLWPINKAKNWTEFTAALEKYRGSPQTFLYTDTTGNIAQYLAGYNIHLGQIITPANQVQPLEGELTSIQPNFLIANDGQLSSTSIADNVINSTPAGNSWAVKRASAVLQGYSATKTKCHLEDLIALQGDNKAPLSELVTKTINTALIETNNADQYEQDAIKLLTNWDGQLTASSFCASIYESFLVQFTKRVLQNQIGDQLANDYINKWPYWTQFTAQILNKQITNMLPTKSFTLFSLDCLSQSLKNLRLVFSTEKVPGTTGSIQWQKIHQLDFQSNIAKFLPPLLVTTFSPFLPKTIGIAGDQDCLNSCNYQINNQSPLYSCSSGPTARLLIDMADNDKFYHSLIFGQSGHLFSKDRIDNHQLKSWQNMEFHAIAFSTKQLEQIVRHRLTLNNNPAE